jgi:hypothetical protein
MDITEMGATDISNPGSIVSSFDSPIVTIEAGKDYSVEWDWTAKGATTGKWMVVSLLDESGALLPTVGPNNPNIYKQEFQVINPNLTWNLLNPIITPLSAPVGTVVKIEMPVQNNGNEDATVILSAKINQSGNVITQTPGTQVGTFGPSQPQVIKAGQTMSIEWDWTAAGAASTEWLTVQITDPSGKLYPAVGPTNPNIFKPDGFEVTGSGGQGTTPAGGVLTVSNPTALPNPCAVGGRVTVTLPILINGSNQAEQVQVNVLPQAADGGANTVNDQPNLQQVNIQIQPNTLTNVTVSFSVSDLTSSGAIYVNGLNERRLQVDCYIGSSHVYDHQFMQVFNAQKGVVVPVTPIITASYANGVITYTLKNFTPNAHVVARIEENGLGLDFYVDSNGSYSGSSGGWGVTPGNTYTFEVHYADDVTPVATVRFTVPTQSQLGGNVSINVILVNLPSNIWGVSNAQKWQAQWFDAYHNELDSSLESLTDTISLSNISMYGNMGVQLFDSNDNSLGTQYSQEYTPQNGGLQNGVTYVFDYASGDLMTEAEYEANQYAGSSSGFHSILLTQRKNGHRYPILV